MNTTELIAAIDGLINENARQRPSNFKYDLAETLAAVRHTIEQLDGRDDELARLQAGVDRLTPRWQDVPSEDGWYWVLFKFTSLGYIADIQAPVWIYKNGDNGRWYISDPDTVHDELLNGMRVAPCLGRPAE